MILEKLKSLVGPHEKAVYKAGPSHNDYRVMLEKAPLKADLHMEFAKNCFTAGRFVLAYAEFKTALSLGAPRDEIQRQLKLVEEKLAEKEQMEHNQYYRFATLAREVRRFCGKSPVAILDVGGGDGRLSQFIPDDTYCLVEPKINGVSGMDLPFADKSFDCVVACHVFEHVPIDVREKFLDQLLSKAKKGLILLNPFYIEGSFVEERLNLFIEITGADWAKEHLACTLPELGLVEKYAKERGLNCRIRANGTLTTSIAMVFLNHFSGKAVANKEMSKIHRFYNALPLEVLDSDDYPTAHLVTISCE